MPESPVLTFVDPRAQRHAHMRQRLLSAAIGALIAGASAVPFLVALDR